jgi:plasmid stability protein
MGQILVRNLEDGVIERLKARALKADKSLEQAVRDILTEAAKPSKAELWAEIDRLREEAGRVSLDAGGQAPRSGCEISFRCRGPVFGRLKAAPSTRTFGAGPNLSLLRAVAPSQRDIVVLLPGHLLPLVAQHV